MILILKLTSGEELIGDVTNEGSNYIVKRPCLLQLVPSRADPTQPMVALMPYAIFVEDHTISVDSNFIIWKQKPSTEIYNQYNSIFGTGIQLM